MGRVAGEGVVFEQSGWYYPVLFGVAFLGALLLTPLARAVALRTGFVDAPGERKVHTASTPYLGGAAIFLACMLAVLARYDFSPRLLGWAAGASMLFLLGLVDDRRGMEPKAKLVGQLLAAGVAVVGGASFQVFGAVLPDALLTLFWIVGITNAVNLLDNMDGLSAGTTGISCFFLFLIASQNGQFLVGGLALAIAGACAGFLVYNFRPASIFMGDAGSLFLGYTLAVACVRLEVPLGGLWDFLVPVVVVGLPILDTTLVTLLRTRAGRPVYLGGKDHCSHRLVKLGYSQRDAVLLLYGMAVVFGGLGLAASRVGVNGLLGEVERALLVLLAAGVSLRMFVKLAPVPVYETPGEPPTEAAEVDGFGPAAAPEEERLSA